jgi:DNA invertase Pin-like site-specific DNA recombinase
VIDQKTAQLTPARRALLYDRVSTLAQSRSGHSGGAEGFQLDRCRTHAAARSYICAGELTDVDSGAEWNIAGIMQALERANRGEYDILVVSDTSRFARNLAKKTVYEAELRRHGVTVEYLNLPLDDGPEGRFISTVFGALDELERERIAWRTQQGIHKKA